MDETLRKTLRQFHIDLLAGKLDAFGQAFDPNGGYEHSELLSGGLLWGSNVAAGYAAELAHRWLCTTHTRELHSWFVAREGCFELRPQTTHYSFVMWQYKAHMTGSNQMVVREGTSRIWTNSNNKVVWLEISHKL